MTGQLQVLQACAWYPPQRTGGTEVYLSGLVESLTDLGVASAVVIPRELGAPAHYAFEGAAVSTYPPAAEGRETSLAAFEALLRASSATIYHQHSWTPDCGIDHLRAARRAGLKTVLTVHVASNLCLRGTMMRLGAEACDGRVDEQVCAACWLQSRGAPLAVAKAVARLPAPGALARLLPGRAATALAARDLSRRRRADVEAMIASADQVVAVCQWLYDALALNGAPAEKLILSRQGVSRGFLRQAAASRPAAPTSDDLRLLYLGRWHPVKGIDVVVGAIRLRPSMRVRLTIHALPGDAEEAAYRAQVEALAGDDPRIVVLPPLARDDIAQAMADHDLLVVPSTGLETGPLVALEAQAVGLPVLGSRLGGLTELIDSPTKGTLVAAGDPAAWGEALQRLADRGAGGDRHPPGVVRSMDDAARDMVGLYESLA